MGWFDEQIATRKRSDIEAFEDSCLKIAGSVMGQKLSAAMHDEREQATDAIGAILKYYKVKAVHVPERIQDIDEVLEYLLRPSGIMTRKVRLKKDWRKDASGPMLTTFAKDGKAVALIPDSTRRYRYLDPVTGVMVRITKKNEDLFSDEAIVFYKPFPMKKLGKIDLFKYILSTINMGSLVSYLLFTLAAMCVGMIIPYLTMMLLSDITFTGNMGAFAAAGIFMVCASVSGIIFKIIQSMFLSRLSLNMHLNIEAATMMRILSLPSGFFKKYPAGDLAMRAEYMNLFADLLVEMVFSSSTAAIFSIVYIVQIFTFAPSLALPAIAVMILVLGVTVLSVITKSKINKAQMELESEESGLSYALITGIEKIKLAGAERRAFAKWGRSYSEQAAYLYDPPMLVKVGNVISKAVILIGTIVIYYMAFASHVDMAEYYAFNTAYAYVLGALEAFTLVLEPASHLGPILDMIRPIVETEPEISLDKPVIDRLSGGIELNNITFRYREDMPVVIDNLSLKIRPGQYVAITGKTGCGKSTLMRIMLGFETPQRGAVYYDGKDVKNIDHKSLRSRIGTVMQNGSLFTGDLYSNIVISDPTLTMDDAWEAAELAGLADDIRDMPMKMYTLVGEGNAGVSGGQKQRLMIARAIAPKPKILMLDEATSALDNITQKQVSDSLDKLNCTRVVIAHRLSTIKNCDRIIVLDKGHIVEDGTYDELMEKDGFFAELVRRQQVLQN